MLALFLKLELAGWVAAGLPIASSAWRASQATVVLPLVPVIPHTRTARDGQSNQRLAISPMCCASPSTGSMGTALKTVAPQTATLPRSFSARVHSFAATPQGVDLAHHNVFFAADPDSEFDDLAAGRIPTEPTLYLCAEDRGFGTPPPTVERFEIISNAPATDQEPPQQELNQWHHQIMQTMADMGVTFDPTPPPTSITTPAIFADLFPETLGALYGQTPHGMTASLQRPTAISPIANLFLAGGGTHPGAGVPMATLSARHAAEAILHGPTSTSMWAQTATPGGMSTG